MTVRSILENPAPPPKKMSPSTDEADAAEHLRTQFLRRVAHDIASPTGVTLTVLEELANAENPRPELVAMARRSLRRLMRLSEHLALVAELESGPLEPELAAADLRALAKQAVDEALSIDGRKDVVAACDLPSGPVLTAGDGRLLLVVFREVIGNALKLASSRVEVALRVADGLISLRVDDDGPGFAEDSAATLGRRFVKRSSARGLGLSLSMAMEILRAHGGTLAVEQSRLPPGRRGTAGAAVVISLPSTSNDVVP
ncbi:MAG: putative two-component sensor kinase [Labilithrix sp.]|nr:putative two-component sensor kinase [Labilithrix sp.]